MNAPNLTAWRANCSAAYLAAYDRHAEAAKRYDAARVAYRTRLIGDAEFLAARAKYDAVVSEFDRAFATEQASAINVRNR